jgi:hypothetical protein
MSSQDFLAERLCKIEALHAGAATPGERDAAGAAAERIRARLTALLEREPAIAWRFSIPDPWSRRLFIALCRRYRLQPYRRRGTRQQSVLLEAPRSFVEKILWPEYRELEAALREYLARVTDRLIRHSVFGEVSEASESDERSTQPAARLKGQ